MPFQERQAGRQAPAVTVLAFAFLRSDAAARRRSRAIVPSNGHLDIAGAPIPLWLAAIGVVIAEYALAAGFWFQRTRRRPRGSGVAFHATLRYVIRIGFLDVVSLFLYAAFLLPLERDVGRRRGPSARIPEA